MLSLVCRGIVCKTPTIIFVKGKGLNAIVATNVRRFRLESGESQEHLAELCGVHRTFIGSIERGEYNITLATLEKLAHGLRVTAIDLLEPRPPLKIPKRRRR